MKTLKKRESGAFGRKVYLLGIDQNDRYLWLEEPRWDCGWYWGFGYVEEYTNHKQPQLSKDVRCHTHWDSIHKDNASPFKQTTFTTQEYDELKNLFEQFYTNRKLADSFHQTNEAEYNRLNKAVIPKITANIINILTDVRKFLYKYPLQVLKLT